MVLLSLKSLSKLPLISKEILNSDHISNESALHYKAVPKLTQSRFTVTQLQHQFPLSEDLVVSRHISKPISVWIFMLQIYHLVWTEWGTASSYNILTYFFPLAEMGPLAHASQKRRTGYQSTVACGCTTSHWGSKTSLHWIRCTPCESQLGCSQRWRWKVRQSICWPLALDLLFPKKRRRCLKGTKVAAL